MVRDAQQGVRQAKLKSATLAQRSKWKPSERGLVASAARVSGMSTTDRMAKQGQMRAGAWQEEAWSWLPQVGEYRYSVTWVGNLLSKAVLQLVKDGVVLPVTPIAGEDEDEERTEMPGSEPVALTAAVSAIIDGAVNAGDVLDEIYGGRANHPEMLRNLGIHFTVAGEAYLLVHEGDDGEDEWLVIPAVDYKVQGEGSNAIVTIADGIEFRDATVVRMWRPDPRHIMQSDSPSRSVLGAIRQAFRADQHVNSQLDSRLTVNGLMFIPDEVSIGAPSMGGTDKDGNETGGITEASPDQLIKLIMETAAYVIQNPESPEAQIPIIVQVPGEYIEHIKKIDFWSKLDDKVLEIRDRAIRRIALGMDMPPEVLEGTSDLNHWSSWQVEEAAIKSHTEPLLAVIASAITSGVLCPLLQSEPYNLSAEEAKRYSIGVDTSRLRLRPNRSKEALDLFNAGLISGETVVRENGFEPSDMMTAKQRVQWLLTQMARQTSPTPQQLNAILREVGIPLAILPQDLAANTTETVRDSLNDPAKGAREAVPSHRDTPDRALPEMVTDDTTKTIPPALVAAGDLMVGRVLERLGSRVKGNVKRQTPGTRAADVYQVLNVSSDELEATLRGAWDQCPTVVSTYAAGTDIDPDALAGCLDRYTRDIVARQVPHTAESFSAYITSV